MRVGDYGMLMAVSHLQRKAGESEEEVRRKQKLLKQLGNKSPNQPAESQAPNRPHDKHQLPISALVTGAEYTWDIQKTVFHWLLKSGTQDEEK